MGKLFLALTAISLAILITIFVLLA